LRLQAEYYFGSLSKALTAVRKDPRDSERLNSEKILAISAAMHREETMSVDTEMHGEEPWRS